ncbi:MAG: LacI family DNA-binding transcriptional regulator [Capsulimonadaceae bacterium]|nr:LacI family DNA-binding transcriptional regulator [Capsulimonadaceae bacterium]
MRKKPSCIDVAEMAGVSTATVSYVFNGRRNANVPDATKRRVMDAAERIGYRPNRLAKGLAGGKTHLVGMVTRLDTFDARIASPIRGELSNRGYQVLLAHNQTHWELEQRDFEQLLEHQVDALICISGGWGAPERPLVTWVLEAGIPCVIVNDREASGRIDSVVSDNRGGAKAAIDHLVSRGHRRIGHVPGLECVFTGREREIGYAEAIRDAGLEYDPDLVQGEGYDIKTGYDGTRKLLALPNPPSAIFAANDANALGVYRAATDLGLRIPDDLAIVGFGNEREAEALQMTTIDQHPDEMARVAVERLFVRMRTMELPAVTQTVPVTLLPGRTS